MPGRCRTTGLTSYTTKTRATKAIEKNPQLAGGRAYKCSCGGWHVEGQMRGHDARKDQPTRWTAVEWDAATMQLWARCRDSCEWCGQPLRNNLERHHRQRRAVGGDALGNIVSLHTLCHQHVHAHPEEARARGFIVSAHAIHPELVPVSLPGGRVVTLNNDGTTTAVG